MYSRHLKHQLEAPDVLGADGQAFLVDRCCQAYAAVADWQGLQQWLQDLKVCH